MNMGKCWSVNLQQDISMILLVSLQSLLNKMHLLEKMTEKVSFTG